MTSIEGNMTNENKVTGIMLYDLYHRQSLQEHFDIKMKGLSELTRYPDFTTYLKDCNLSDERIEQIKAQCQIYETQKAPSEKLFRLFNFLDKNHVKPTTFLDFGSGNGSCLQTIRNKYRNCTTVGIDKSVENQRQSGKLTTYRTIPDSLNTKFDVILMIHTLHHLDLVLQEEILSRLAKLMHSNSLLFLYEDSWSNSFTKPNKTLDFYSAKFLELPQDEKIALFRANDYWANIWFYCREFDATNATYKSVEQLQTELTTLGFDVIDSGSEGFNYQRIHGVPAGWLLARH